MATFPTPTVLLDDGTGTFPYDITSKVLFADGYNISRGREDWIGSVTAGELTLTLNNSDGRFTPGSTILGTPSPIKVDQRIRVNETVGAGGFDYGGFDSGGFDDVASVSRFTGYVKSWPVSWPAVVPTFAEVQITATDAQARAERRTLRSLLEEEILSHSPGGYYTLGEADGSTSAGDSSGNQAAALTASGSGTAVQFGSGTGPVDGMTAAVFAGPSGQILTDGAAADIAVPSVFGLGCSFATTTNGSGITSAGSVMVWRANWFLAVDSSGHLYGNGPGVGLSGSSSVIDGRTHRAEIVGDGSTVYLLLDGAVVGSGSETAGGTYPGTMYVGGLPRSLGGGAAQNFTGTLSHVTSWSSGLSSANATTIAAAQKGFVGDVANQRAARLGAYAGIPVGTLDTSTTVLPTQATAGSSAWDAIQEVADAEMGLAVVDGTGSLAFYNRNRVATKTAPDLTLDAQYVTTDVQPVTDDQQIVNYFEATAAGTGVTSIVRNTASETTHGRYPVSQDYLVQTDAEALDRANWIVAKQAEPFTRYGTLTINLYKMTATQVATVLTALDLDCWLRVTSMAPQNPDGTVTDVVVQGWQENAAADVWTITCNVVARSLYQVFLVGVSPLGNPAYPLYV